MSANAAPSSERALHRIVFSGLLGAVFWGSYAGWSNWEHPDARWLSAATQGVVSFVLASAVALATERFHRPGRGTLENLPAVLLPVLGASALTVGAHLLAQTPELLQTVLGPVCVGVVYNSLYVLRLERQASAPATGTTLKA